LAQHLSHIRSRRQVRVTLISRRLRLALGVTLFQPDVVENHYAPFGCRLAFLAVLVRSDKMRVVLLERLGELGTSGPHQVFEIDSCFARITGDADLEVLKSW
jgi:hypothetical protein